MSPVTVCFSVIFIILHRRLTILLILFHHENIYIMKFSRINSLNYTSKKVLPILFATVQ